MECPFIDSGMKATPDSLSKCKDVDRTTQNLRFWSERLYTIGRVLFGIIIILGIVMTVIDGVSCMDTELEDQWLSVVISSLVGWTLWAIIEFVAYNALSLLIAALASITYNSNISANVALYEAAKKEPKEEAQKEKVVTPKPVIEKKTQNNYRKCEKCGQMTSTDPCSVCGHIRQTAKHYSCGKCGKKGPYGDICPDCGSSLKKYN